MEQIGRALGIRKGGDIAPERFTGGDDREKEMLRSLTVQQMAVYKQAQQDHLENAQRF